MVAPLVVAGDGVHGLGAVPSPSGWLALHWFTVAPAGAIPPLIAMLLTTVTLHNSVPPPPLAEPLHWSTTVTTSPEATGAPPLMVTTEPVVPGTSVNVLTTETMHCTVNPPELLTPLHWLMDRSAAEADSGSKSHDPLNPTEDANTTARKARAIDVCFAHRPRPVPILVPTTAPGCPASRRFLFICALEYNESVDWLPVGPGRRLTAACSPDAERDLWRLRVVSQERPSMVPRACRIKLLPFRRQRAHVGLAFESKPVPSFSPLQTRFGSGPWFGRFSALMAIAVAHQRADQSRSNRSRFMTLSHAATKSLTNFDLASSHA